MSDLKIHARVFIDFGVNLWENPEEARSRAQWRVVHDENEALKEAERLGMQGSLMIATSDDGTKRMLAVLESEFAGIEDWGLYVRNYVNTVTERGKNIPFMSGCGCGILTGGCGQAQLGCGAGSGCACGSSESCKCEEGG